MPLALLPRSHLPPTPDSPCLPTILPLVSEPIEQLTSLDGLVDYKTASYSSYPAISNSAPASLLTGLNVLTATRDALDYLHHIYTSNSSVQESFTSSVSLIAETIRKNGRLMVCGVGKSGKIAHKFVATCNSMRIRASILDPTDALHGDLGGISEVSKYNILLQVFKLMNIQNDTIALLTASSNTPELLMLLPHLTAHPLILLTARPHTLSDPNPLIHQRLNLLTAAQTLSKRPSSVSSTILLLTPLAHGRSEKQVTGVSAPTVSTTITLAVCDALAVAVAQALHGGLVDEEEEIEELEKLEKRSKSMDNVEMVFRGCHPGGNLGIKSIISGSNHR